jgi:hypothetical protein
MKYAAILAAAAHPASPGTAFYVTALVVVAPLALYLLRRVGDVVPGLIFVGLAVLAFWVVPTFPRSPVACLQHDTCGSQQTPWVFGLVFLAPLAGAVAYKMLRGDKRGVNGRRLP